ncbi:helix-turn-helix transcriptional regulator [Altererythrobacter soli]|uniref:Helix-turn-helix transcriptional regulator n=1 Tax=Croceibacterium soli TaxID=1739690 RepID=A0A6I4USK0_9SPHN|nr:LuxR C-terminal-related transcriptional regulator [Croceibacterium soli]MXP41436.1 helix-turn-helix transcriptional regulator [Croceibacterium soli]
MEDRLVVHVVDGDRRTRAEHARIVQSLGHHAEVHADLDGLLDRPPQSGVVLVRQHAAGCDIEALLRRLGDGGIWLPVIVAATEPGPAQIVAAIKSGALDFLPLPMEPAHLARSLGRVMDEAATYGRARQLSAEARRRVGRLSKREREVLEWLSLGCSNKIIARELGISPRTVEIHRANMMVKLGARHAAEAIRVWLQAELESTVRPDEQTLTD